MMAAALTLLKYRDTQRRLHLFDTFEGMSAPTEVDQSSYHSFDETSYKEAEKLSAAELMNPSGVAFASVPLEDVWRNVASVGYQNDLIKLYKGRVEETLPNIAPSEIALLRLDTDWYESTHHELVHLYPRSAEKGVLIIDDYGHWEGAKKAVDEYIANNNLPLFLNRIDYTGRLAIKCSPGK